MDVEPIVGAHTRFPPGHVKIRLGDEHRRAYQLLYAHYRTVIDGLPVLRERDFDGRAVTVTVAELEALNQALARLGAPTEPPATTAFGAQEQAKSRQFKKLQFLH
jgi:hypothetical protein